MKPRYALCPRGFLSFFTSVVHTMRYKGDPVGHRPHAEVVLLEALCSAVRFMAVSEVYGRMVTPLLGLATSSAIFCSTSSSDSTCSDAWITL